MTQCVPTLILLSSFFFSAAAASSQPILRGANEHHSLQDQDVPNKLKECLSKTDSASCASTYACEWCPVHEKMGLCMPSMYAEMAQCDKWEDMDTTCIVSAMDGDDPESSCEQAKDQQGGPCVWCHGFGAGICLDEVQVESAKRFLRCGEGGSVFLVE